jgi:hypothetical protein
MYTYSATVKHSLYGLVLPSLAALLLRNEVHGAGGCFFCCRPLQYLVMELSRLGSLHHLLLSHGSMLSKRVKLTICQQV